jgi:RNA polymerase I-specific transcription initiation factor RRN3
VFYTVCQALMMIFCFRWKALRSESSRRHSNTGRSLGGAGALAAAQGGADVEPSFADDMEMDDVDEEDETDGHGAAAGRSSDEPEWIPDLKILQKAIHSQLNPLMVSIYFACCLFPS